MTAARFDAIRGRLEALGHWEHTCDNHTRCEDCPYHYKKVDCIKLEESIVTLFDTYLKIKGGDNK